MSENNAVAEKVELGMPEVWVKRGSNGQIRSVRSKLVLREAQNELVEVAGKLTVSAIGYYRANQIASLGIITPNSIMIPGPREQLMFRILTLSSIKKAALKRVFGSRRSLSAIVPLVPWRYLARQCTTILIFTFLKTYRTR